MKLSLPTDSAERKTYPLMAGLFGYFPAALAGVAHHSWISNEKHNKGQPLHWSIDKSNDHAECVVRHALDLQEMIVAVEQTREDVRDIAIKALLTEVNALAWRALALSQILHMQYVGAPMPFNARRSEPESEQNPADVAEARAMLGVAGCPAMRCSDCQQQPCACKRHKTLG